LNVVEKQAIAIILQALLDAAAANKTKVLAYLTSQNASLEAFLLTQANKISPLAGAVVSALGPEIIAYLGSEEDAVFAILVADVEAYQASLGVSLPAPAATAAKAA
jgi:hypothetical protein